MKCRDCCRREVYACLGAIALFLIEIVALAAPWYAVAATNLPKPWDSLTAVFYWSGMEALYSPPLIGNERSYNLAWADMITTMPKDVYMGSIALCFLALFGSIAQFFVIFLGYVCPGTTRLVQVMFCGFYKWVCVAVCFAILILCLLSWTIFFAFNAALSNAQVCPGTTAYNPSPFPVPNGTLFVEPLWCDSFANSRQSALTGTDWVWAPSLGWIFALISTVAAFYSLCIMLTVETDVFDGLGPRGDDTPLSSLPNRDYGTRGDNRPPRGRDYDDGGRGGSRRDGDRNRDRDRDRGRDRSRDRSRDRGDGAEDQGGRGHRSRDSVEDRKRDSRRYDDEKMQKKYDSFRV